MNIKNTFKPYIDAPYYINIYKADLNARIEGNFNKVAEHKENFDAFRNRASELVNRLTHNAVEEQGGIDYLQERPAAWIAKATAALVEYWYINDYKIGDININFSLGGMSLQRLKQNETFRKFVPETVVAAIQASGLAKNSVAFFDSTGSSSYQVCENELDLTELDARYQRKGNYDANFHTSIDIQGEQTQTVDTRYYKIAQVMKDNSNPIVFSMIADRGREFPSVKYFVSIAQTYGLVDASNSGVAVMTPVASTVNLLDVYVVEEADTLDVYVKGVDNDMSDILITDIAAANYAEFANYGSRTTAPDGSIVLARKEYTAGTIDEANILAQIAQLTTDVEALDGKLTAADLPQIRIDLNKNTNDLAELKADYLSTKAQVQTNKNDIATLSPKVNANTNALKNKLDIQYTANDNGKLPQVIDGKLQLVVPSSLQASNVLGINLDDASLTTTNKRYASAVNELNRDKVAYRNQGSTFKVDGDDAVNYDLRNMEVNNEAIKATQASVDAIIKAITKTGINFQPNLSVAFDNAGAATVNWPVGTDVSSFKTGDNVLIQFYDTATQKEVEITDQWNNGIATDNVFYSDTQASFSTSTTGVAITGVATNERTNKVITKLVNLTGQANATVDVSNKANIDLGNVSNAAFVAKATAANVATNQYVDAKTIDLSTAQNGKKYILDKPAGATKPVLFEFDPNAVESKIAIIDISNLTSQDAIYNAVSVGKQYFMSVDTNKQYLMQGLCVSKDATQAHFVGYSWNTQVGHTNTVKATANKNTTTGDHLSFTGVPASEILADDNAIVNTSAVKSLFTNNSDKLIANDASFGGNADIGLGMTNGFSIGRNAKQIDIGGTTDNEVLTQDQTILIGSVGEKVEQTLGVRVEIGGKYTEAAIATKGKDNGIICYYENGNLVTATFGAIVGVANALAGSTITFEDGTTLVL